MARKFKFTAEPVLKIRQQAERQALQHLAEAQRALNSVENAIRAIRDEMAEENRMVREGMLTGQIDVNYISLYRRRLMILNRQLMDQAVKLREAAMEVARRRSAAMATVRDRKAISKLKENRHRQYIKELERTEQKQADEVYIGRISYAGADGATGPAGIGGIGGIGDLGGAEL